MSGAILQQQPIYKAPTIAPRTHAEIRKSQTKQMIAFFGLGAIAISSGLASRRAVLTRRCKLHSISPSQPLRTV